MWFGTHLRISVRDLFIIAESGVVAQMARASALHAEGRGFESHPLHNLCKIPFMVNLKLAYKIIKTKPTRCCVVRQLVEWKSLNNPAVIQLKTEIVLYSNHQTVGYFADDYILGC